MKLVIIGGSAQSTPSLFLYPRIQLSPPALSVVLVGRSSTRLAAVQRAISTLTHGIVEPQQQRLGSRQELETALVGANVILVQARYGGYEGRTFDETFPQKYGICGDEGLGPGGLAAAWRAWPRLEALLSSVHLTCPGALVLLMSSPLGILTRAALARFRDLRLMGICELPWTTLQSVCNALDLVPSDVNFQYAGINHLGWLHHVYQNGRDLVSEYAASTTFSHSFPSAALIHSCEGIPLKYLRLHYFSQQVLHEQRKIIMSRGALLEGLQSSMIRSFAGGSYHEMLEALKQRPCPWYEHAIAPFIASLIGHHPADVVFFLTCFNKGYIPNLDDDDVIEIPYCFRNGDLDRLTPQFSPSTHILSTLQSFVKYERRAADAVLTQDLSALEDALAHHPWVRDLTRAQKLAAEITSQRLYAGIASE